ncbi:MAG: helix-turn-helix domain-containing protein [Gaiellaceae bacterium]
MTRGIPFFERGTQRLPPWKFDSHTASEEQRDREEAEKRERVGAIADELMRSADGRSLAIVARDVGLAAASLTIELPAEVLEHVIEEVARRLREEMTTAASKQETFNTKEAAEFLRTSEQRIYDLVSQRRLRPEFKDGTKNIFQRSELEAYLRAEGSGGRKR